MHPEAGNVIFYGVLILVLFLLIFIAFIFNFWIQKQAPGSSPYTGLPLRKGSDLPYESKKKILQFLYDRHEYDNRPFSFKKAAFCRETGRIFSNALTWYGSLKVDWSFLQRRFPGHYVSWGSLSDMQKTAIMKSHDTLAGFQTAISSTKPSPNAIEPEMAYEKPGPLYVDLNTKVFLGWQMVPETDFEVLIVQKPK